MDASRGGRGGRGQTTASEAVRGTAGTGSRCPGPSWSGSTTAGAERSPRGPRLRPKESSDHRLGGPWPTLPAINPEPDWGERVLEVTKGKVTLRGIEISGYETTPPGRRRARRRQEVVLKLDGTSWRPIRRAVAAAPSRATAARASTSRAVRVRGQLTTGANDPMGGAIFTDGPLWPRARRASAGFLDDLALLRQRDGTAPAECGQRRRDLRDGRRDDLEDLFEDNRALATVPVARSRWTWSRRRRQR